MERLWGTLQDRLLKEMRVAGVTSIEAANAFLPRFIQRYNARFAKEPQDPESAWVRIDAQLDLDYYFSVQQTRLVRKDQTISWHGQDLLILRRRGENGLQGKKIAVHTTPEGEVRLYYGTERLRYRKVEERPPAPEPSVAAPKKQIRLPDPKSRERQRRWLYAPV